jgi:CheY-like chemotaxis protein
LIQQLEGMLTRLIGENIQIVTKLAKDLKMINVDPSQMEQVILNLVVNAKDALPKGGNITIQTKNIYLDETFTGTHLSVEPGQYVLLSICDDGIGMDPATVEQIFEPFFTTKPEGKGTGLGLTTTYGIIKQSGGTIWVYSELNSGTVFKIYLPVAEELLEEVVPIQNKTSSLSGTETILLVEDDERLREGFSELLQSKGYKVLVAANGKEALSLSDSYKEKIHFLLTDVVMSGLSGFELAKKILDSRTDLHVLYMSGYTSDALENSEIENFNDLHFIQKPFGTKALLAKIREILNKK